MPTNSLSTDWDKFYGMVTGQQPGTMMKEDPRFIPPPSEQPKRVTGEGLNVYERQTVAVDPFTGDPIVAGGNRPADIIQNIPAPAVATAPKYSALDTVEPLDINNLGLTRQSFFAKPETSAERAIAEITVRGGQQQRPWKGWGGATQPVPALMPQPSKPLAEREPGDWWTKLWLGGGGSFMPQPSINNPATQRRNPQVAQAMAGRQGAAVPASAVAQAIAAQPGYNGTNNVTSSELRPVHSSIFSGNAVLPSSMNTRRWVGDGY